MKGVVVLIVDDEEYYRERWLPGLASQALVELMEIGQIDAYEIKKAGSPEEARALIAKKVPHLLISDNIFLGSEEMGAGLVVSFADTYPDRYAILVSGKTIVPELKAAIEGGRPNTVAIAKRGNNAGIIEAVKRALG